MTADKQETKADDGGGEKARIAGLSRQRGLHEREFRPPDLKGQ